MKFKDLFEMPYNLDGDAKKKFGDSWISYGATKRLYTEIAQFNAKEHLVKIYQSKENKLQFVGLIDSNKKIDNSPANKWVFSLKFKEFNTLKVLPLELKDAKILQVDYVESASEIEGYNVAPFTYMSLVQDGFTIISDTAQFNGGIGLWKKLAREAGFVDMKVNVLDDSNGFTKDADGNLINYDGSNLLDKQIWTDGLDLTGEHTLLVLLNK